MSADEAVQRSGGKLSRVLRRKRENPPGQVWRDIDDRNNFGPAFFFSSRPPREAK